MAPIKSEKEIALETLLQLLKNSDVEVRASAAEVLGDIGNHSEAAAIALLQLLKETEEGVREAICKEVLRTTSPWGTWKIARKCLSTNCSSS